MISETSRAVAKGVNWEMAKGHLRALVAIDGAVASTEDRKPPYRFQLVSAAVEKFIKDFEDEGLQE